MKHITTVDAFTKACQNVTVGFRISGVKVTLILDSSAQFRNHPASTRKIISGWRQVQNQCIPYSTFHYQTGSEFSVDLIKVNSDSTICNIITLALSQLFYCTTHIKTGVVSVPIILILPMPFREDTKKELPE